MKSEEKEEEKEEVKQENGDATEPEEKMIVDGGVIVWVVISLSSGPLEQLSARIMTPRQVLPGVIIFRTFDVLQEFCKVNYHYEIVQK